MAIAAGRADHRHGGLWAGLSGRAGGGHRGGTTGEAQGHGWFFVIAHAGFSLVPLAVGLAADMVGSGPALAGMWVCVLAATLLLLPFLRRR